MAREILRTVTFVQCCLLILFLVSTVKCLRCFSCPGVFDLVRCTFNMSDCPRVNTLISDTVTCIKAGDDDETVRGCSVGGDVGCWPFVSGGLECYCDTDLCNAASSSLKCDRHYISIWLSIATTLLIVIMGRLT